MGGKSKIEWTERVWNPWWGCQKVSAGCAGCYAVREVNRLQGNPKLPTCQRLVQRSGGKLRWTGRAAPASEDSITEPLRRKKPTVWFVNSLSDFWFEGAEPAWRMRVVDIMQRCPQHVFQILTKRPEAALEWFESFQGEWPANAWVGVSVENRDQLHRIDLLRQMPITVRFLSLEPLLGPLVPGLDLAGIDWVIVGGESPVPAVKPTASPMAVAWVRAIRDLCREANVPFFFKQFGQISNNPDPDDPTAGTAKGGRTLDGVVWSQLPRVAHQAVPPSDPPLPDLSANSALQSMNALISAAQSLLPEPALAPANSAAQSFEDALDAAADRQQQILAAAAARVDKLPLVEDAWALVRRLDDPAVRAAFEADCAAYRAHHGSDFTRCLTIIDKRRQWRHGADTVPLSTNEKNRYAGLMGVAVAFLAERNGGELPPPEPGQIAQVVGHFGSVDAAYRAGLAHKHPAGPEPPAEPEEPELAPPEPVSARLQAIADDLRARRVTGIVRLRVVGGEIVGIEPSPNPGLRRNLRRTSRSSRHQRTDLVAAEPPPALPV